MYYAQAAQGSYFARAACARCFFRALWMVLKVCRRVVADTAPLALLLSFFF